MAFSMTANLVRALGIKPILLTGSFRPNAGSGIVSGSTKGLGYTVARTAAGTYTLTFAKPLKRVQNISAAVRTKLGNAVRIRVGAYSAANKTLVLYTNQLLGWIDFPLLNWRALTANDMQAVAAVGGLLASNTASGPVAKALTAGKEIGVEWAVANTNEIGYVSVVPPDMDQTIAATFKVIAACADLNALTLQAFFGVNGTDAGGAMPALGAAAAVCSLGLTQANQVAPPSMLTLQLTPGAHAAAVCDLYAAWMEYTIKDTNVDLAADADNEILFSILTDESNAAVV